MIERAQAAKGTKKRLTKTAAPRVRRTQAERRDQTRLQILEVSAQLIRERGVSGLRTQEVAKLAGVSQGAQFHHFPTKDALVVATFDFVHDRFVQRSRWEPSADSTLADVVDHIIEDAFDFYFDDAFYLDLALGIDGKSALLGKVGSRVISSRHEAEDAWLVALAAKGLRKAVARDVLATTLSLVRGFGVRYLMERNKPQFLRLCKWWREILLDHLEIPQDISSDQKPLLKRVGA